jgi:hypothetical protein|tara:strand:+ start:1060 stop:1293 length:234 start_codon:yes stop_codon:yes gene_type:complete
MNAITLTGEQIDTYRAQMILNGLYMEVKHNMRLTAKAPTCYSLAKKEYGLKGNKVKVYNQLAQLFLEHGVIDKVREL